MFGLLKKKIGDFISNLVKKEEEKPVEEIEAKEVEPVKETPEKEMPENKPTSFTQEKPAETKPIKPIYQEKPPVSKSYSEDEERPVQVQKPKAEKPKHEARQVEAQKIIAQPKQIPEAQKLKPKHLPEEKTQVPQESIREEIISKKPAAKPPEERKLIPKLGLFTKVKSFFSPNISIKESEVEPLLDDLRLAMLESDVSLDTAEYFTGELKTRLVGKQIHKSELNDAIKSEVKTVLTGVFAPKFDLESLLEKKPCVIMFVGPNGAGKTTTIAKIASMLKAKGKKVVLAASDSFRSGAIHQLNEHASAIGVSIVKHDYGADPTAVAFDAIAMAKARGLDVVLIDTAGRQETNFNLVKEMEKMNRILKPDAKIFVGEAVSGHALVEQAKKFQEAIGLDAMVLTKMDCDAKGGTSFSIAYETKLPFLFLGTGQNYEDLRDFDADWLVANVLAA